MGFVGVIELQMMLCSFLDLRQLVGPDTMINVNLVGLMEVLLLFFFTLL